MQTTPLTPHLGVQVDGVDLATLSAPGPDADAFVRLLWEHGVVVVRDQELDRETHKELGRRFGPLHVHPSKRHPDARGDKEIFTVKAGESTRRVNGGRWHSDVSCDENPPAASLLRLIDAPPVGGDTVFADMHRAFTTLSAPIRELLVGLEAFHDGRRDLRWYGIELQPGQTYPSYTHPVVVAHPVTGRPTLHVNEAFTEHIVGLESLESEAVLSMLYDHIARRPELHCRVRWEPGTVVIWDNRAVQHHAVADYLPANRRGERVTIEGQGRPVAWSAA